MKCMLGDASQYIGWHSFRSKISKRFCNSYKIFNILMKISHPHMTYIVLVGR